MIVVGKLFPDFAYDAAVYLSVPDVLLRDGGSTAKLEAPN